ncbi:TetR/AcrR family transcriptional regulator [Streptomyces triticirhizae]|uniref:TetR family transcriptional regulator n=1 Tax=Streptomyces triticirhizae TaxID=2483353 RepID=A0A3M2LPJ9_9ACTN|nr:TetR/AcrR family transcriptional regulator [Streptomyces triticirhizae]RMI39414.1 TetR family transcriptional regulator [Streptomyces triticirhizae]
MPRPVDRDARRQAVAGALLRIAARDGLSAVSMRTVADEAGMSLGAVQRYFASKDELLRFAFDVAVAGFRARLDAIGADRPAPTLAEALRQALLAFLPTDEESLAEARIWVAFCAEAAVRPEFARAIEELDAEARDRLGAALAAARAAGHLPASRDPAATAELFLVIIDGLLWSVARHPPGVPLTTQRAAVEAAVAALTEP